MKVLGTGLSGLIGSRLIELLHDRYEFQTISRAEGIDITNQEQITQAITSSDADIVLHLAAMTDVKGAEAEKSLGEKSFAWQINVKGTEYIAQACQTSGKKLIYFSTDLMFDGQNIPEGGYTETDQTNPVNWYAKTKYEGELRVQAISSPWLILRPAYPYRADYPRKDFVRTFISLLQQKKQFSALTDRIITPTFIDDLAAALDALIIHQATGKYHASGSQAVSIYDAAKLIATVFALDASLISQTTRNEFLVGRPAEPLNSSLNIHKIEQIGVHMHSFEEGLQMIKQQMGLS